MHRCVVVTMKIRVLGICVCCNYNELVDIGEKLVSVLRIAEHGSLILQIMHFPFSMPVVY